MDSTVVNLKSLAVSQGAQLVGITSSKILADGPLSTDPRYLLPSANSVISFACSLDTEIVQDFISKKTWRPHCENRKQIVQTLYKIGDALVEKLQLAGYEAVNVDINCTYRPEEGATDITEMTEFHPDFSHRYAALAAGIGRLGWSGNLLTKDYGALVELGSVITSAALQPDTPLPDTEHPCDRCRMCCLVCPAEMIQAKVSTRVTVAGVTETIARKRPNTCCWIYCTGYEGLASSGTWSNWSPYRLDRELPGDKHDLDALCTSLQKADPQMQSGENYYSDYRHAVHDEHWFYYTVCGFCRSVCSAQRKDRLANRHRIVNSGTAALKLDGSHVVAGQDGVEIETPFGLRVVVPPEELLDKNVEIHAWPGQFPLDREVIKHLHHCLNTGSDKIS